MTDLFSLVPNSDEPVSMAERLARGEHRFTQLDLGGELLEGLDFVNCHFDRCDLRETSLNGAKLEHSRFSQCRGMRAKFHHCLATDIVIDRCDFTLSEWSGSTLSGASFTDSKMMGADFREVRWLEAKFSRSIFANAYLRNLSFRKFTLDEIDFSEADLAGADFRDADLTGSRLGNAELRGAKFKGADLRGCDLGEIALAEAANFRGATISRGQATELLRSFGLSVI